MSQVKKLMQFVKSKPFFVLLLTLLFAVFFTNIKPGYEFAGWDNYSSYFNLKSNIFRTFFASWREYRGMGVQSDSEVVDIFRQIAFFVFDLLLPISLVDQLYHVFSLAAGIILVYFFTAELLTQIKVKDYFLNDLGAFVAATFYLFNLHTLSVFYFPITPYIARFFAIPLLYYTFQVLITRKVSIKRIILLMIAILFSSTSYLTATIFITVVVSLMIFIFSKFSVKEYKKGFFALTLLILLNSFWLLQFANYTLGKTPIIKLAPTFINANESQLNKHKDFFNPIKQLILRPNFFDTQISSSDLSQSEFLHPLTKEYDKTSLEFIWLIIFPALYLFACIAILLRIKKYKNLVWIPITIFLYIFLSLKEFSFLGWIYAFLSEKVPYFNVLFRFGDTKFHPYISFVGSVAIGLLVAVFAKKIVQLGEKKHVFVKKHVFALVFIFVVGSAYVFRTYFTGQLFGFFMTTRIPKEYYEVASYINTKNDNFRVLHLPYDDHAYWRSYKWGYIGSAFFNFMLDNPLYEKTFEPASMENAAILRYINDNLANSQSLDEKSLDKLTDVIVNYLENVGVKYVLLDESVSADITTRGAMFWGTFSPHSAKKIFDHAAKIGLANEAVSKEINFSAYKDVYKQIFYKGYESDNISASKSRLVLYELKNAHERVRFLPTIEKVDNKLTYSAITKDQMNIGDYMQLDDQAIVFPFVRKDGLVRQIKNGFEYKLQVENGKYRLNFDPNLNSAQRMIEIRAKRGKDKLEVNTVLVVDPEINGKVNTQKLNSVSFDLPKESNLFTSFWGADKSFLRLSVNGSVISIPQMQIGEDVNLGVLIVDQNSIEMKLLAKNKEINLSQDSLKLTNNPNCYSDALENYEYSLKKGNGFVQVESNNGSTCFWQDIRGGLNEAKSPYFELGVSISGSSSDLDVNYLEGAQDQSSKPVLKSRIRSLEKPNTLRMCVKYSNIDDCLNKAEQFNIGNSAKKEVLLPLMDEVSPENADVLLFYSLKNIQYQKQTVKIYKTTLYAFDEMGAEKFELVPSGNTPDSIIDVSGGQLVINIPSIQNAVSYRLGHEDVMPYVSNALCGENKYRTYRIMKYGIISYLEGCENVTFQKIPFDSSRFYLWGIDYNVMSGQQPKFVVNDGFYDYIDEYVSQYNGYPDIKLFGKYQNPESIKGAYNLTADDDIQTKNAYVFVYPKPEFDDVKSKNFSLQQYSDNEGILYLKNYFIQEMPSMYASLKLVPINYQKSKYSVPGYFEYKKILPSLRKVLVKYTEKEGVNESLLYFNESFDEGWAVYPSIKDALLGKRISARHYKCNGLTNCFVIDRNELERNGVVYLFYGPERLALLGWLATILTVITTSAVVFAYRKNNRTV